MQLPSGTKGTNVCGTNNSHREMFSPYRQRESALWSRGDPLRVESPSKRFMAVQLTKPALSNTVGSLIQLRMTHPIIWSGPGRCCHVDIVVVQYLPPSFHPLPPWRFFMAIFACICISSFCAHGGEEPSTWGGWGGAMYAVEWRATLELRH